MRRSVVISLVIVMILVGILARSGAMLALSLPLLIYIGAGLFLAPAQVKLDLQRFPSADHVNAGAAVTVKLTVTNQGRFIPEIQVEDGVPPGLNLIKGTSGVRASLAPREEIRFEYSVTSARGIHLYSQVNVKTSDPFDLFPQRRAAALSDRIIAMPDKISLHPIRIQPPQTRPYPGVIHARKGGSGIDFYGIREYQPGDAMRWVNWQTAARHAEDLFTNQFEQENIADVGIIVDARQQTDVVDPAGGDALFEYSIRVALGLAETFLNDGNRVSLLVYGYGMDRVFPGYGKAQRERIQRCLAQARTGHNYPLESLNYLPTRLFAARSQLVMVSPLSRNDAPQLIRLKAAGYDVLIISPDPVDFQARILSHRPNISEAVRLAQVERALLLQKIFRAGIRVVDWKVTQPADHAIQTATRQQLRVMRPIRWQR